MNRLSPLIARRAAQTGATAARASYAAAQPDSGTLLDDAKLFATGWLGGLIFFGTFIG